MIKMTQIINEAFASLKKGDIITHPADTCYGLAGMFGNEETLKNLQSLKGRDGKKPMSIMLPKTEKWAVEGNAFGKLVELDDVSKKMCNALLPGPVTLLLPKGPGIPDWYFPETNLIGIRIPADKNCQQLLEALNEPIMTTSANRSGEPLCETAEEIQTAFKDRPDLLELILTSPEPLPHHPSTVILIEDRSFKILREGPLSQYDIEKKLEEQNII